MGEGRGAGGYRLAGRDAQRHPARARPRASAAATVGALVVADALSGGALGRDRILALANGLEGHPDNATAALLGGFIVVAVSDGRAQAVRFDPPRGLTTVLFVPELQLVTREMRAALPASVPHRDAAYNIGRAALTVAAFASGRRDLLRTAIGDRLHEPYRARSFPALPGLVAAAREAGALGACLSGAGSSVIAFTEAGSSGPVEEAFLAAAAAAGVPGSVRTVPPRLSGALVVSDSG